MRARMSIVRTNFRVELREEFMSIGYQKPLS